MDLKNANKLEYTDKDGRIEKISDKEKDYIINQLNCTYKKYNIPKSLSAAFEQAVKRTPKNVALIFENETMTYEKLNQKVNQYAKYFISLGVTKEVPVGIYMNRSIEMMIAIYGVLKAGGAYVPLDIEYPEDRLCFIADELEITVIIKGENEISDSLRNSRTIVDMTMIESRKLVSEYGVENIDNDVESDNMAYIIYTSGSTGKPKGVVITHEAILNRLYWMQDYFKLKSEEKVLQKTPISFDVSVWELFWPLLFGGTLVLAKKGGHKDSDYLIDLIVKEGITTLHFVPSMLQSFLDNKKVTNCESIKRVICSGEALEKHHVKRFFNKLESRLFNLYGPTEAAVDVSFYECKMHDIENGIPIGKPISNCQLYILGKNLELLPIGEEGELYIGGVCLSRGYYNRPNLTKEKFIQNPFSNKQGEKLYRTGDLVKYREDGEIMYINRTDFQVKLRGLRIELGEIENCIRENTDVSDVVVTMYSDVELNDNRLVAYVKPKRSDESENSEKQIQKENELERVAQWKTIFDQTYAGANEKTKKTIETDFSGWVSSYTGNNIPREEMLGWVNSTVDRIKALNVKRILEIGCGTGLLMYKLASYTTSFVGIDLSDIAVENLQKDILSRGKKWEHVRVLQGSAENLDHVNSEKFDCVVINSVIQLFPSVDYLFDVIKNALQVLDDGGKIFIGDIRDYQLAEAFHSSVELYKATDSLSIDKLKMKIKKSVEDDKELLIAQDFFTKLSTLLPMISNVEIISKKHNTINELTKYRYDVVLYKNASNEGEMKVSKVTFDYRKNQYDMEQVEAELTKNQSSIIRFMHMPNALLQEDVLISHQLEVLNDLDSVETVRENINKAQLPSDFYPADLYDLGEKYQRKCMVRVTDLKEIEAVFCPDEKMIFSNVDLSEVKIDVDIQKYANAPITISTSEKLISEIKESIIRSLPEYMLPSSFVLLEEFPLLPNGKLNRKALPAPMMLRPIISTKYVEPKTRLEKEIADIWKKMIKVNKVGIEDSFFELGGHSLLSLRFLSIISKNYTVEISLSDFLKEPTILGVTNVLSQNHYEMKKKTIYPQIVADSENQYKEFPLTEMQQAYFIGKNQFFALGNVSTHVYTEFEFESLDYTKFGMALNLLIKRHDMLRCIAQENGTQIILKHVPEYRIEEFDIADLKAEEQDKFIEHLRNEMFYKDIDFTQYPLFQVKMTHLGNHKTRVHVCYENLILDGASHGIMIEDMLHFYNGNGNKLPPFTISFRDYIFQEIEFRKGYAYNEALNYWKERCKTLSESPRLPINIASSEIKNHRVKRKEGVLRSDVWSALQRKAALKKLTPNTVLLSAFSEVIALWSGQNNFTINIPTFHRLPFHKDVEDMVGEFGSIILLEVRKNRKFSFLKNSISLQETFWSSLDHSIVSGVEVLRELSKYRENTLMPIVFTSLLTHDKKRSFLNESVKTVYWRSQSSQVWIDAVVSELNGELHIDWDYVDGIFDEQMLQDIFECFLKLLNDLASQDNIWSETRLSLLPEGQKEKLQSYNNTYEEFEDKFLHQVFYENMIKYPNAPACICEDRMITYKELYSYSIYFSDRLRKNGVKPNELVGIVMEKGWQQIVATMSVLFSGAAYLPLDVNWPKERQNELLADGNVQIVLTQEKWESYVKTLDVEMYYVVKDEEIEDVLISEFDPVQKVTDLAYVIYTSGSTGKPKGVAISHTAVMNTIQDINHKFHVTNKDRTFCISEMHFDLSVYDIWGMFAVGGAVVIPTDAQKQDITCWKEILLKNQVTIWNSVPAIMEMHLGEGKIIAESMKYLRLILLSGDWIPVSLPDKIKEVNNKANIISLGGATEASIWSIYYPIDRGNRKLKTIPYGKPLANQRFYVLNRNLGICPEWVEGELYIGGKGLAEYYWNDEEKTNQKFIIHPITKERLYATGDLGRYMENGNIEFIGRKDFQVKINGYRVELGEIENVVSQYEGIQNSLVVFKEVRKDKKHLIAYYISDDIVCLESLRQYLEKRLPKYMIPRFFINIDHFPLTQNGKVNREALPLPDIMKDNFEKLILPKDEIEKSVLDCCKELLKDEKITLLDDFFMVGGNSIIAIQFIAKMREKYNVSLSISEIFSDFKILKWAQLVKDRLDNNRTNPLAKQSDNTIKLVSDLRLQNDNNIPLTYSQEGIWLQELLQRKAGYTLTGYMNLEGNLSIKCLVEAIKNVIRSQSIFSIKVDTVGYGDFIQTQCEDQNIRVELVEIESDKKEKIIEQYKQEKAKKKFDMKNEPFYDILLICCSDNTYVLILTLHHIISDEETFSIFYSEMIKAYHAICNKRKVNVGKELQYADFACWQRDVYDKQLKERDLLFWKNKLKDLKYLELFDEKINYGVMKTEGKFKKITLSNYTIDKLLKICVENNVSLYMGCITVYSTILSKISDDKTIFIGAPLSNRSKLACEELCGMFTNMTIMPITILEEDTFPVVLKKVCNDTLEIMEHGIMPFDEILRSLKLDRKFLDLPYHININYLGSKRSTYVRDDVTFHPMNFIKNDVAHNLGLLIEKVDDDYSCYFSYRTEFISDSQIDKLENYFCSFIDEVIAQPDKKMKDYLNSLYITSSNVEKATELPDFNW